MNYMKEKLENARIAINELHEEIMIELDDNHANELMNNILNSLEELELISEDEE